MQSKIRLQGLSPYCLLKGQQIGRIILRCRLLTPEKGLAAMNWTNYSGILSLPIQRWGLLWHEKWPKFSEAILKSRVWSARVQFLPLIFRSSRLADSCYRKIQSVNFLVVYRDTVNVVFPGRP